MSGWLLKQICVFFIGSLNYLEKIEDREKCYKMFNEVDDGKWEISDYNHNDVWSDSAKWKRIG